RQVFIIARQVAPRAPVDVVEHLLPGGVVLCEQRRHARPLLDEREDDIVDVAVRKAGAWVRAHVERDAVGVLPRDLCDTAGEGGNHVGSRWLAQACQAGAGALQTLLVKTVAEGTGHGPLYSMMAGQVAADVTSAGFDIVAQLSCG